MQSTQLKNLEWKANDKCAFNLLGTGPLHHMNIKMSVNLITTNESKCQISCQNCILSFTRPIQVFDLFDDISMNLLHPEREMKIKNKTNSKYFHVFYDLSMLCHNVRTFFERKYENLCRKLCIE